MTKVLLPQDLALRTNLVLPIQTIEARFNHSSHAFVVCCLARVVHLGMIMIASPWMVSAAKQSRFCLS